ncbi:MAG: hypothetical protein JW804_05640 [Sedimentisphaerales bacterium]|nr:hypothetical protein [Sedimentisphaerales bacterium]
MLDKMFKKWSRDKAAEKCHQMEGLRIYPPASGTLFDQLEFVENLEIVLKKIETSNEIRQIILEGWLLIDYIITYVIRDALGIPECIEEELELIPFSFVKKIDLIKKLIRIEGAKLPNYRSFQAYELHPEFHSELIEEKHLYKRLMEMAIVFERKKCPKEAEGLALKRGDFENSRFVPEWWYENVSNLDNIWFDECVKLNKARNIVAHNFKMRDSDIFKELGVSSLDQFKKVVIEMIKDIVFKKE